MRLDKTRRVTGQALQLRTSMDYSSAILSGFFGWRSGPLSAPHATAMLALAGGLFIISASEK